MGTIYGAAKRSLVHVGRLERWYSHAIPSIEALDLLVELAPLLGVGGGAGYWVRLLSDHGGDVVATEPDPTEATPGSTALRSRGPRSSVLA